MEPGPLDRHLTEQRVLEGHIVASMGELRVGQAFCAVLDLVGRHADGLEDGFDLGMFPGGGPGADQLIQLVLASDTIAGAPHAVFNE